jgi:tryptophan 2,3-dioxygenase
MLDWDQRLVLWRTVHLKLVERIIGGQVIGTQGTPVEVLGRRLDVRYFQALWDIRNQLTDLAHTSPRLEAKP